MREHIIKHFKSVFFVGLLVLAGFIWYTIAYYETRYQKSIVSILDVGQGDGVFIEAPDGNQILIDGGPDHKILTELGAHMLPWDRDIDLLILTHPHADHLDGLLEVLRRFSIGTIIESGVLHSIPEYNEWHQLIVEKHIPLIRAKRGQEIIVTGGLTFRLLSPLEDFFDISSKNIHDSMVVVKMTYGSTTAMLTGDMEQKLEYALLAAGDDLSSDILKVGHHGSKTSTSADFLQAVSPRYAVISVGKKNRYGHPVQEVLDRLKKFGITMFRTDQDGSISFISDGRNFLPK